MSSSPDSGILWILLVDALEVERVCPRSTEIESGEKIKMNTTYHWF